MAYVESDMYANEIMIDAYANEMMMCADEMADPIYVLLKSAAIADARKALQGSMMSLVRAGVAPDNGPANQQARSDTRSSTPSSGNLGNACLLGVTLLLTSEPFH